MSKESLIEILNRMKALDTEREALSIEALEALQGHDSDVANEAIQTLESERSAAMWLTNHIPSLGDEIPLSLLLEGQRERVLNTLKAIEHGVYT